MKKILLVLVVLMTMCLGANAQSDGFFRDGGDYSNRGEISGDQPTPLLPGFGVGYTSNDQPATAPLGSGLLILTALGGAYLFHKKD